MSGSTPEPDDRDSPPRRLDRLSGPEWELVHTTYAHHLESLERNEEMGERRLQLLFAVASAAAVAVGLVADGGAGSEATLWAAAGSALVVSLIGLLTVMRLAKRNRRTTKLINGLRRVRKQAADENAELTLLFVDDPYEHEEPRTQRWVPTEGGLVDVAGCATAAFMGFAVLFAVLAVKAHLGCATLSAVAVAAGLIVAVCGWLWQVALVQCLYAK